jgi:excisionase family DNA binding protein
MGMNSAIRTFVVAMVDEIRPALRQEIRAALSRDVASKATEPPALDTDGDALLTVSEAAAFCAVTVPTMRKWLHEGVLPMYRIGNGRTLRVRRRDLMALLQSPHNLPDEKEHLEKQARKILSGLRKTKGSADGF